MNYILSMARGVLPLIICIVLAQYILAMLCIYRLFKYKPRLFGLGVWNFIIIAIVFIGPIFYLITNLGRKEPGVFFDKLVKNVRTTDSKNEQISLDGQAETEETNLNKISNNSSIDVDTKNDENSIQNEVNKSDIR